MSTLRIVGISFDHMHMGDLLRMVHENPDAEIAAIDDPDRAKMQAAVDAFAIPEERVFTDFDVCMAAGSYDMAILCAATAEHATFTERLAPHGVHVFVEKPICLSAHRAYALSELASQSGLQLRVGHTERFNPVVQWLRERLTDEQILSLNIERVG